MSRQSYPAVVKVVGSLNWDIINHVEFHDGEGTHRTFKDDDEDLQCPGGHGANQAVAVYRSSHKPPDPESNSKVDQQWWKMSGCEHEFPLDVHVYMIGKIGGKDGDKRGDEIKKTLSDIGVNTDGIGIQENVRTGYAHVDIDGEGKPSVGNKLLANNYLNWEFVREHLESSNETPSTNLILVQKEIPDATVRKTIEYANENRIPIIFNPAPAPGPGIQLYGDPKIFRVDHLILNRDCAERICKYGERAPRIHDFKSVGEIQSRYTPMCDIFHSLGASVVVITLGYRGVIASYLEPEDEEHHRSQRSFFVSGKRQRDVLDETGASDAFIGAYAVEVLRQMVSHDAHLHRPEDRERPQILDIAAAIELGIKAGGLATEEIGSLNAIPWRPRLIDKNTRWLAADPFRRKVSG